MALNLTYFMGQKTSQKTGCNNVPMDCSLFIKLIINFLTIFYEHLKSFGKLLTISVQLEFGLFAIRQFYFLVLSIEYTF